MPDLLADLQRLRACFDRDVSELPDQWTEALPSTGCCHVAALVIRAHYGGRIMRCKVFNADEVDRTHYFNIINGVWVDATADQFIQPWQVSRYTYADREPINSTTRGKSLLLARRFNAAAVSS